MSSSTTFPYPFRLFTDSPILGSLSSPHLSCLCPPTPPALSPRHLPRCRLAARTLRFFVRHVALVRPLSEAGKLRLARDMGELEFAVGQQLMPVQALGGAYRALRALRPLLFAETEAIPGSSLVQVCTADYAGQQWCMGAAGQRWRMAEIICRCCRAEIL